MGAIAAPAGGIIYDTGSHVGMGSSLKYGPCYGSYVISKKYRVFVFTTRGIYHIWEKWENCPCSVGILGLMKKDPGVFVGLEFRI